MYLIDPDDVKQRLLTYFFGIYRTKKNASRKKRIEAIRLDCLAVIDTATHIDALDWQDAGFCWIPVSERLPEKCGWYLCTLKDDRVNAYYYSNGIWLDNAKKHLFDLYDIRSRFTGEIIKPEQESVYWTDWVTAWMPLPRGFKARRGHGNVE